MSFQIRFQGDVPHSRRIAAECERTCDQLRAEFPEALTFEVSLGRTGEGFDAHVHVTGRQVSVAASARVRTLAEALHAAFARTERQLRKHHDKRIFARRREVQRPAWV
jgi:ribosome-associated translation inhibitor RaiA